MTLQPGTGCARCMWRRAKPCSGMFPVSCLSPRWSESQTSRNRISCRSNSVALCTFEDRLIETVKEATSNLQEQTQPVRALPAPYQPFAASANSRCQPFQFCAIPAPYRFSQPPSIAHSSLTSLVSIAESAYQRQPSADWRLWKALTCQG